MDDGLDNDNKAKIMFEDNRRKLVKECFDYFTNNL